MLETTETLLKGLAANDQNRWLGGVCRYPPFATLQCRPIDAPVSAVIAYLPWCYSPFLAVSSIVQ